MKHPNQHIYTDHHGTDRFTQNRIVRFLLDAGGYDMNKIATMDFDDDDRAQFAQLIGYSVGGWNDLSYVSDAMWDRLEAERAAPHTADAYHQPDRTIPSDCHPHKCTVCNQRVLLTTREQQHGVCLICLSFDGDSASQSYTSEEAARV